MNQALESHEHNSLLFIHACLGLVYKAHTDTLVMFKPQSGARDEVTAVRRAMLSMMVRCLHDNKEELRRRLPWLFPHSTFSQKYGRKS